MGNCGHCVYRLSIGKPPCKDHIRYEGDKGENIHSRTAGSGGTYGKQKRPKISFHTN